jgi:hypothetical protein
MLRIGETGGHCGYVNGQDETPRSCGKPSTDSRIAIFLLEQPHSSALSALKKGSGTNSQMAQRVLRTIGS